MEFDKRKRAKREIENLDSSYPNFEPEKPSGSGAARKITLSNPREVKQCECGP
jgi:hypothetical protein